MKMNFTEWSWGCHADGNRRHSVCFRRCAG